MANPTEGQPEIRVEVYWDPVNGTFEVVPSGDPAEVRVIIARADDGEVIFDSDPQPDEDDSVPVYER